MESILIIIGIIFIFIALKNIKKYQFKLGQISEDIYKVHSDVKEYYFMIQDILGKMEELIDIKIENIDDGALINENIIKDEIIKNTEVNKINNNDKVEHSKKKISSNTSELSKDLIRKQMIELYKTGVNIQEIAKQFKKGISETEVIIKIGLNEFKNDL